jgi:hypothetical protein
MAARCAGIPHGGSGLVVWETPSNVALGEGLTTMLGSGLTCNNSLSASPDDIIDCPGQMNGL